MKLKTCPLCDSKRIHEETGAIIRKIHGKKVHIPGVTYWICLRCHEKTFPAPSIRKMAEFLRQKKAA